MRRAIKRLIPAFAVVMTAVVAGPQVAGGAPKDKQPVIDDATMIPVTGAFSQLDRSEDGVATKVRTAANSGHANTLWYVIFNAPENCNGGVCGEDDIFVAPGVPNEDQIQAARVSVLWSGAGAVTNPAGRLSLGGGLAEGEVPDGPNQVVIGRGDDGALVPLSPVTGLEDALGAEVHIVVQDHGPAHEDQTLRDMQLTQFMGACNPDCVDIQFAVHQP